jgi:hypothetical protein
MASTEVPDVKPVMRAPYDHTNPINCKAFRVNLESLHRDLLVWMHKYAVSCKHPVDPPLDCMSLALTRLCYDWIVCFIGLESGNYYPWLKWYLLQAIFTD